MRDAESAELQAEQGKSLFGAGNMCYDQWIHV